MPNNCSVPVIVTSATPLLYTADTVSPMKLMSVTGRHVTCYFTIQVSAHTITTPSSIQLIGLPFTSFDTTAGAGVSEHIGNLVLDYFEFGLTPTHVSGKVLGGTAKVDLYWHGLSAGPTATIAPLDDDNLTFPDGDYVMIGTITYITEDPTPPPDEPPR